jgi:hypothetical protein
VIGTDSALVVGCAAIATGVMTIAVSRASAASIVTTRRI